MNGDQILKELIQIKNKLLHNSSLTKDEVSVVFNNIFLNYIQSQDNSIQLFQLGYYQDVAFLIFELVGKNPNFKNNINIMHMCDLLADHLVSCFLHNIKTSTVSLDPNEASDYTLQAAPHKVHRLYNLIVVKFLWNRFYDDADFKNYLHNVFVEENAVYQQRFLPKFTKINLLCKWADNIFDDMDSQSLNIFLSGLLRLYSAECAKYLYSEAKKISMVMQADLSESVPVLLLTYESQRKDILDALNSNAEEFEISLNPLHQAFINPYHVTYNSLTVLETVDVKSIIYSDYLAATVYPACTFQRPDVYYCMGIKKRINKTQIIDLRNYNLKKSSKDDSPKISAFGAAVGSMTLAAVFAMVFHIKEQQRQIYEARYSGLPKVVRETPVIPKATYKDVTPKFLGNVIYSKDVPYYLKAIAHVESSGGKNLNHPPVNNSLHKGTSAIGFWGLMPIQIHETIKRNPKWHKLYPYNKLLKMNPIKDHQKMRDILHEHIYAQKEIAKSHWDYLVRNLKDEWGAIYAWHHGLHAARRHVPLKLHNYDDYVKKVLNAAESLSELNKTEEHTVDRNISFYFVSSHGDDDLSAQQEINSFISHASFKSMHKEGGPFEVYFVGNAASNFDWVLKVEANPIQDIHASPNPASVKEYLFYVLANRYFDIKTPAPVVLGEVRKSDGTVYHAIAIRFVKSPAIDAANLLESNPSQFWRQMDVFKERGVLHRIAATLYILGSIDAHGHNFLLTNNNIWSLDFGNSFATFLLQRGQIDGVKLPFVLSVYYQAGRSTEILNQSAKSELAKWLYSLPINSIVTEIQSFGFEDATTLACHDRWLRLIYALSFKKELGDHFKNDAVNNVDRVIEQAWLMAVKQGTQFDKLVVLEQE